MNTPGRHPWVDDHGKACPKLAAAWTTNLILMAGGRASLAYQCGLLIAEDIEQRPELFKGRERGPYNTQD